MTPFEPTMVEINERMAPPSWALKERLLLQESAKGIEMFAQKYVSEDGYLKIHVRFGGADGPDDAAENFSNWPLLYVLGADESVLSLYKKAWNGHIKQYSEATYRGSSMFHKEFITSFDWHHNGEQYAAFNFSSLVDPTNPQFHQRVRRFAGFYMNEDEEAPNYDEELRIIRSMLTGSRGPTLKATYEDWGGTDYFIPPPYWDEVAGDNPVNMTATTLATNAYLLTGEEKYRQWVLEYVDAWKERAEANGGIFPSNIGLSGKVGEAWDGKWWGGVLGWDWIKFGGFYVMGPGMQIGMGNALLLSGDLSYMSPLRAQCDALWENRIRKDDRLVVPGYYGDDGWHGEAPIAQYTDALIEVYLATMNEADLARVNERGAVGAGGYDWMRFLQGDEKDYPDEILDGALARVCHNVARICADETVDWERTADDTSNLNPAITWELMNLMLGGVTTLHHRAAGGLLFSRFRYFDPVRKRPGLPMDVAALVDEITDEDASVILVNLSQTEPRYLIVQTGAYGEHQCSSVHKSRGEEIEVGDSCFLVRLAPGAGERLTVQMKRYANTPSCDSPGIHNRFRPSSCNTHFSSLREVKNERTNNGFACH